MARRLTIERILRDDDDMNGQTIRDWKIESEAGRIVLRLKHGDGFISMRADDIELFVEDLRRAGLDAREMAPAATKGGA